MNLRRPLFGLGLLLVGFSVSMVQATDLTWVGASNVTGDWFQATNWSPTQAPTNAGDTATITNGTVMLTNETVMLGSLVITNATLIFSNWTTRLLATNVTIRNNGKFTLPPAFITNANSPSNRMHIVCSNLSVETGGLLDADGKGFAGKTDGNGYGPGGGRIYSAGGYPGGGGGHGGQGGQYYACARGAIYDLTNAPTQPGSGGGAYSTDGGHGGGAVFVEAGGTVTVNGAIRARGIQGSSYAGGGAGGSIFITCRQFGGATSGVVNADGGRSGPDFRTGAGGGGRVAIGIGLSAQNITDLLAGSNTLSSLFIYDRHSDYGGLITADAGVLTAATPGPGTEGEPGTRQFMTVGSPGSFLLTIAGAPASYGAPESRGYGTHLQIPENTWITNMVCRRTNATTGLRRACLGWQLTQIDGSPVDNGVTTQSVFQVTTNLVLTWNWTNEWLLTTSAGVNGSVNSNVVNGWYTNAFSVTGILATVDSGYRFGRWMGDVPSSDFTNNPLTLTLDQPRTVLATFQSTNPGTKIWPSGTGDWIIGWDNWSPPGAPGPLDDVIVQSGNVILAEPMTIGSLLVSNGATMTFSNWTTQLTVNRDVTVRTNGVINLPATFTDSAMSNRVDIACDNLTLDLGGKIDVTGKGFTGGPNYRGTGPGKAQGGSGGYPGAGAGHGGIGGYYYDAYRGGLAYDSTNAPVQPGSGGGSISTTDGSGGDGGGAVRIDARGSVTINGRILANGMSDSGYEGGGSGGSIFIMCNSLVGNGQVNAEGGNGGSDNRTSGGGGGRIAVWHGVSTADRVRILADPDNRTVIPYLMITNSYTQTKVVFTGTLSVTNGISPNAPGSDKQKGTPGSLIFLTVQAQEGLVVQIL